MRKVWVVLVATLTGLLLGVAGAVGASVTDPDTIVRVEGDAANGFGIHRHDGSALFPPTGSEARAECSEYDRLGQRVRCRTATRVWYRELAEIQRSLEWALAQ
ncbi:hypothetical protein [Nocardioides euryhalodurans]|uniref:Uncharacterized protein n=1 Tax=Nocardioides euryhalodurans TaxID=2518370 RepID=A0A4P7GJL8_9ACTN|nr:hypothetical protein [Nocardioides euryhalodurans]QBR92228.1 hypothetical protein EXE57_07955 [Nocardioides euryhalodurans]